MKILYSICQSSEGWPDIVVWLLNNGSRVAFAKISAADIVHSVISEQKGEYCGRIQTLCLKVEFSHFSFLNTNELFSSE